MAERILRCKMRVESVKHSKNEHGETEHEEVTLRAVYASSGPNAQWSKWTPAASFNITINNPSAIGHLSRGHEYFVDFFSVTEEPDEASAG